MEKKDKMDGRWNVSTDSYDFEMVFLFLSVFPSWAVHRWSGLYLQEPLTRILAQTGSVPWTQVSTGPVHVVCWQWHIRASPGKPKWKKKEEERHHIWLMYCDIPQTWFKDSRVTQPVLRRIWFNLRDPVRPCALTHPRWPPTTPGEQESQSSWFHATRCSNKAKENECHALPQINGSWYVLQK